MKTIKDLKIDLHGLEMEYKEWLDSRKTKPPRKLIAEIKTVKQLIRYLETNPTEEIVREQIAEVRRKLNFMPDRYNRWFADLSRDERKTPQKKLKAIFNKEHEVTKLRAQLQTLNRMF